MELIKETEQLIRDFNRILKLTWFYSPSHPTVKDTLQKVATQLQAIIPPEGYLLFNISGNNLFLGAIPLSTKDENVRGFVKQLKKRRINSLLFYPGVGLQELEELIAVLALDPKMIRKQGGIKPALASREITHIDVTEYQYQPGSIGSGTEEEDTTSLMMLETTPERISHIIQYLQGTITELDPIEMQLFSELMNDPMRIAELQSQAVQHILLPESSATATQLGEITRQVLTRVQGYVNNCPEEEKVKLQRKIALSLLHQDPSVALHTIATGKEADTQHIDMVRKTLENLDDTELINLITASEYEQQMDLEKVSSLFFQLPIDSKRTEGLLSKFTDLLVKRRETEENETQFIELQLELNRYPASRILTHSAAILLEMLEKGQNAELFTEILQALQKGTNQLFELNQFSCLYDIYRSIHRLTLGEHQKTELTEQEDSRQKVREFYAWLTDTQMINQLVTALEAVTTTPSESAMTSYTATPEKPVEIPALDQHKIIIEILAFIGTPAIPMVVDKLNKTSFGSPVYQSLRHLLVRFGDASIPLLESTISPESEGFHEQILSILNQIGTPRAKAALVNIIPKLNPTLQKQVIFLISQSPDEPSLQWLINRLQNEKDPEIQLTVLDGLAKIKTKQVIDILISYATPRRGNKKNRIFQQRAIQLIGKHKIAEAVPSLIKLFHQKSFFFAKRMDPIRIAAAQALAQIGTAEAMEVVRAGCQDKRAAVRSICQTLVKK
ncbi:MAG: HEAT repeat domain-containing protein [bacterium]|nr:HEAT repeat domain-containing protein [bacterium]